MIIPSKKQLAQAKLIYWLKKIGGTTKYLPKSFEENYQEVVTIWSIYLQKTIINKQISMDLYKWIKFNEEIHIDILKSFEEEENKNKERVFNYLKSF